MKITLLIILLSISSCTTPIKRHFTSDKYSKAFEPLKRVLVLYSGKLDCDETIASGLSDDFNLQESSATIIGDSLVKYIEKKIPEWSNFLGSEYQIKVSFKNLNDFNNIKLKSTTDIVTLNKLETKLLILYEPTNMKTFLKQFKNDFDAVLYIGYNNFFEMTKTIENTVTVASAEAQAAGGLVKVGAYANLKLTRDETDVNVTMHYNMYDLNNNDVIQKGWGEIKKGVNNTFSLIDIDIMMKGALEEIIINSPFNKNFSYNK